MCKSLLNLVNEFFIVCLDRRLGLPRAGYSSFTPEWREFENGILAVRPKYK